MVRCVVSEAVLCGAVVHHAWYGAWWCSISVTAEANTTDAARATKLRVGWEESYTHQLPSHHHILLWL